MTRAIIKMIDPPCVCFFVLISGGFICSLLVAFVAVFMMRQAMGG